MKKTCPIGSIFVKAHNKTIDGREHYWKAHCRKIKSRKYILNSDEIKEIYQVNRDHKTTLPKAYTFGANNGLKYDHIIAFWVEYWSREFNIKSKITVGLVKTLMMSESTFGKMATARTHNRAGTAIGLLQLTDYTLKLLRLNLNVLKEMISHIFGVGLMVS
jgi:hypothetical protein